MYFGDVTNIQKRKEKRKREQLHQVGSNSRPSGTDVSSHMCLITDDLMENIQLHLEENGLKQ